MHAALCHRKDLAAIRESLLSPVFLFESFRLIEPRDMPDCLQWETVKERVIKSGTLEKLVHSLVNEHDEFDSKHFHEFFTTYRAFATPADVLRIIIAKYQALYKVADGKDSELKLRAWRSCLMCWLESFGEDFRDSTNQYECLHNLVDFTARHADLVKLRGKAMSMLSTFRTEDVNGESARDALDRMSLLYSGDDLDTISASCKLPDVPYANARYIAEQFTYWDSELYKRVIPHQCMGCFWARRNKGSHDRESVRTVKATVDNFNLISARVISTILASRPHTRFHYRAKILSKWIEVLKELRSLKNYSSLKAILSALNNEPVHRLNCVWREVPKSYIQEFDELNKIFSEDQNSLRARELLEKEGTAKSADLESSSISAAPRKYRRTKSDMGTEMQGTVPYLGTFLTDLTYIDTAFSDETEEGLINFDKRRREFHVLAKIKLFQSAAQNYHIVCDPKFKIWFARLPNLSEAEWWRASMQIEPVAANGTPTSTPNGGANQKGLGHRKCLSSSTSLGSITTHLFNNSSSVESTPTEKKKFSLFPPQGLLTNGNPANNNNNNNNSNRKNSESPTISSASNGSTGLVQNGNHTTSHHHRSPVPHKLSAPSWQGGPPWHTTPPWPPLARENGNGTLANGLGVNPSQHKLMSEFDARMFQGYYRSSIESGYASQEKLPSNETKLQKNLSPSKLSLNSLDNTSDVYVARIKLDSSLKSDTNRSNLYKCVKFQLENSDKTHNLIQKALEKHDLQGSPSEFVIAQLLPSGDEFQLPEKNNAFYAVHRVTDENGGLNFVLRRKNQHPTPSVRGMKRKNKGRAMMIRWNSGIL